MDGFQDITPYSQLAPFNENFEAIELQNIKQGKGVVDGLVVSAGTGLAVNISSGTIRGWAAKSLTAISNFAVPPSTTSYIWIDESGAPMHTATTADPGGTYVLLGTATTDGSAVTSVAKTGRMEVLSTSGNSLKFGNRPVSMEVNSETLAADKTGAEGDALIQILTPSVANRKYKLPPADARQKRVVVNGATSGVLQITVERYEDATIVATLDPGEHVTILPQLDPATMLARYGATYTVNNAGTDLLL
jgi:hypothetical protein